MKRFYGVVWGLVVWATLAPPAGAQDSLWATYAKSGAEALWNGKYKEAAQILERAVAEIETGRVRAPAAVEARMHLGLAYKWLGRYGDADRMLSSAVNAGRVELPPTDKAMVEAVYRYASLQEDRGKDKLAIQFAEWLIAAVGRQSGQSRVTDAHEMLAGMHTRAGRYDAAQKSLDAALDYALTGYRLRGYFLARLREKRAAFALDRGRPADAGRELLVAVDDYQTDKAEDWTWNRSDVWAAIRAAEAFAKASDADSERRAYARAEQLLQATLVHARVGKDGRLSDGVWDTFLDWSRYHEGRKQYDHAEAKLKELHAIWVDAKGPGALGRPTRSWRSPPFTAGGRTLRRQSGGSARPSKIGNVQPAQTAPIWPPA